MTISEYFTQTRSEMLPVLPGRYSRALEIGCGSGQFASQLRADAEVWGIEPDEKAALVAAGRMQRVLVGMFSTVKAELPHRYFDLLICNDVIEHMTDHDAFLRDVQAHLAPGAHIVVSVPNLRFVGVLHEIVFKGDFRYRPSGILDRTHLRFFTLRSLRRSAEEAGLIIEYLHGIRPMRNMLRLSSKRLLLVMAILLSFGRWGDMRYQQVAMRARLPV